MPEPEKWKVNTYMERFSHSLHCLQSISTSHHQPQPIPTDKMCPYWGIQYEACGHEVRYPKIEECSTQRAFLAGTTESECQEKTWEITIIRYKSAMKCEICEVEKKLSPTNELLRKSQ